MQLSNSFEKVFSSLSVVADNVAAINDFRSTFQRLREFEAQLGARKNGQRAQRLMPSYEARSDERPSADVELVDPRSAPRR